MITCIGSIPISRRLVDRTVTVVSAAVGAVFGSVPVLELEEHLVRPALRSHVRKAHRLATKRHPIALVSPGLVQDERELGEDDDPTIRPQVVWHHLADEELRLLFPILGVHVHQRHHGGFVCLFQLTLHLLRPQRSHRLGTRLALTGVPRCDCGLLPDATALARACSLRSRRRLAAPLRGSGARPVSSVNRTSQ